MSDNTAIEWTEATWNPVTGCDRVSEGCDHCYALTLAKRLKAAGNVRYQTDGHPRTSGPGFGLTMHWDVLSRPLSWRRPRVVFVNSMSDLFHPKVPEGFIAELFNVMEKTERQRQVREWQAGGAVRSGERRVITKTPIHNRCRSRRHSPARRHGCLAIVDAGDRQAAIDRLDTGLVRA